MQLLVVDTAVARIHRSPPANRKRLRGSEADVETGPIERFSRTLDGDGRRGCPERGSKLWLLCTNLSWVRSPGNGGTEFPVARQRAGLGKVLPCRAGRV